MKKMNALSFWQPYAWLIVNGHADVDSRTWSPTEARLGRRIAVHASKRKMSEDEYQSFLSMVKDRRIKDFPKSRDDFEYGSLIGTVVIEKVVTNSKSYWAAEEHCHWILKDPRRIKAKPQLGRRSWFSVEL